MANEDPNKEVELLRKQLNDLKREREAANRSKESGEEQETASAEDEQQATVEEIIGDVNDKDFDLSVHFKQFLDTVDNEFKDAKPSALLIVFALGVLIGRLR